MKATTLATFALSALLQGASAKEIPPSELVSEIYDSGSVHMDLMARKKVSDSQHVPAKTASADTQSIRNHGTAREPPERWSPLLTAAVSPRRAPSPA